jgi:DNA-binding response OmpR family regulator
MRILLVEDSKRLQRSISKGLRKEGFKVDLMLPGLDGLSILRTMREKQRPASVLILSAKDTVDDRVEGLETGADDYLVKPFAFEELLARVRALIRRRYGVKHKIIAFDRLKIDLEKRMVSQGKKHLELPPREYAILELLALRKGTVVSRAEIEEHVYDEQKDLMSNVVDAAVSNLRKELKKIGQGSLIKTRRKAGYFIE